MVLLSEIPISALIVNYNMIYNESPPKNREERLKLIANIPKIALIHEFAALNYRLRDNISFDFKIDYEFQRKELFYFCGGSNILFNFYEDKFKILDSIEQKKGGMAIIFNRPSNLFALQEIILFGSDLPHENFKMNYKWDNVLRYYLSINEISSGYIPQNEKEFSSLEKLTAGHLFLGTLQVVHNPIYIFNRFTKIIKYLRKDEVLGKYFANHFNPYGFNPAKFLYYIAEIYLNLFHRKNKNEHYDYLFKFNNLEQHAEAIKYFKILSNRQLNLSPSHDFDLINIKKSPIYQYSALEFILLDLGFLIDKAYTFFINDYFFDYLKPNESIGYDFYASKIGYFFENYVSDLLKSTFSSQNYIIKTLDDLKCIHAGNEIELADFYIRYDNKVIIGQIKASSLNNEQNLGSAEAVFKNEKNFYKDFGLTQTIQSLEIFCDNPTLFDSSLTENEKIDIYPIIILNDNLASSPILPMLFQNELESKFKNSVRQNFRVYPLTLIHIEDLERIELFSKHSTLNIWDILTYNFSGSVYPKPFFITLNRLGVYQQRAEDINLDFKDFIDLKED